MAQAGSAVVSGIPMGAALGQRIGFHPGFGGDCKRSAVVAARPRLGQQETPLLTHRGLMVVPDALLLAWRGNLGEAEIRGLWSLAET